MNFCLFETRLGHSDSIVMRVVIQKVLSASVSVDNKLISKIGRELCVWLVFAMMTIRHALN